MTYTARYKTVASTKIAGLTVEHRPYPNGSGVYVIFKKGRSMNGYAITAGRVAFADSEGPGFDQATNHVIALYTQKLADRVAGAVLVVA